MAGKHSNKTNKGIRFRLGVLILIFAVLSFVIVAGRLLYLQVINTNFYQSKAAENQTKDLIITPMRGSIYDRNMTELAVSATTQEISVSPTNIRTKGLASVEVKRDEKGKAIPATDEEKEAACLKYQQRIAKLLAKYLDLDYDETLKKIQRDQFYVRIARHVDADIADELMQKLSDEKLSGVNTTEDSKRYYKYGNFASQVIGFTNDAGGAYGLEAIYNEELTGESGMVVTARDRDGRSVLYQYDQYFDAENGCDLHTTLDTTIQYYLEKGVQELEARFGTGKGAEGIVMDVNTGAVLAMASLPTYDLNSPGTVYNDFLTSGMTEEQVLENMRDLLNKQWRSKAINDTYEPGSTFKTLTLAMALEENVVDLNTGFYCSGSVKIEGETINCSKRAPGHGQQNLTQAFANSCNPAFINIGLRIGNDKFYQYMLDFGLTEKTGIDTTGEASGFVNSEIKYSTLALACYAFGQNFNVTPIALLAAQCACVNGGYPCSVV